MTFTIKLFKVLQSSRITTIDGYQIELTEFQFGSSDGKEICYCQFDEDYKWFFRDQEVTVDEEGKFKALAWNVDPDLEPKEGKESKESEVIIKCEMTRPMVQEDITADDDEEEEEEEKNT